MSGENKEPNKPVAGQNVNPHGGGPRWPMVIGSMVTNSHDQTGGHWVTYRL